MTARELIGISYSPWTEKARWALDHHKLPYSYSEHLIMLGMPALRLKMKSMDPELTVPALIDGENRMYDSFRIAEHADAVGGGPKLIPHDRRDEVVRLNAISETALDAGRALVMHRISKDADAQKDSLPPFVPQFLRGACRPMVSMGMSYINREFKVSATALETRQKQVTDALDALDEALRKSNTDCLLGEFTFADIAMAKVAHLVEPVDARYVKLTPALRRCWANPELKQKYAHLVEWRDQIYAKYRGR